MYFVAVACSYRHVYCIYVCMYVPMYVHMYVCMYVCMYVQWKLVIKKSLTVNFWI